VHQKAQRINRRVPSLLLRGWGAAPSPHQAQREARGRYPIPLAPHHSRHTALTPHRTHTMPHSYNAPSYNALLVQCPTHTMPRSYNAPLMQCPTHTMSHSYAVPLMQCPIHTMPTHTMPHSHRHAPRIQCPTPTMPHSHNAPLIQCPTHAVPHSPWLAKGSVAHGR
jgi:hypothetical protein